jgi:arsenate reductase (glutaredoxin)
MSPPAHVTLFHNPACSTSRKTLALLRERGIEPEVVEYLKAGWTRPQLEALFDRMGVRPRELLRQSGSPAEELGLLRPEVSDDAILDAMVAHPVLVNRPIAVTPKGARLCRPVETVLELI